MYSKTSSFFRMDEKVIYSMVALCLLSIFLIAFRFVSATRSNSLHVTHNRDSVFVNELVAFTAKSDIPQSFVWDFGDGTTVTGHDSSMNHRFSQARTYIIKVKTEQGYSDLQNLTVYDRNTIIPLRKFPRIIGQDVAVMNETVQFNAYFDSSSASTTWAWTVGSSNDVSSRDKVFVHQFSEPGMVMITLTVNDNKELSSTKMIRINPPPVDVSQAAFNGQNKGQPKTRPSNKNLGIVDTPVSPALAPPGAPIVPSPVTEPPKEERKPVVAPDINDAQIADALMKFHAGAINADYFNQYLCGEDIVVRYQGEAKKFSEACVQLKEIRRIKNISVISKKTKSNNCVVFMDITVKKKGILPSLRRD